MAFALLSVFMLFLSPTLTSLVLLLTSIAIVYLIYLRIIFKEEIKNYYKAYIAFFITILSLYILVELFSYRYSSLGDIYELYILENLVGFRYFDLKEILFGITLEREEELFSVGEIYFLNQLMKYGFLGVWVFYISILYYMIRALRYGNVMALTPNMVILAIFVLGNIHYPVMFSIGAMELFILHLAYIIYHGSYIKK